MQKLGIIDVGSNTIRLILVRIVDGNSFTIYNDLKESVRLAYRLHETGKLAEDRINHAIQTMIMFKGMCMAAGIDEIISVGTAALREASNARDLLDRIYEHTGIKTRVLSGHEEAHYDFLGVKNSMQVNNALLIDIGGASTEIIHLQDGKAINMISMPFGAITLSHRFKLTNHIKPAFVNDLTIFLSENFNSIPWLLENHYEYLIGIGGSIRNIGKIDRRRKKYPLEIHHEYIMNYRDISDIFDQVAAIDLKDRRKISGLARDRADIIVGSMVIVKTLMEYGGIKSLRISGSGLREGIIYNYLSEQGTIINDPLDFSINNILSRFNLNKFHSENVYQISHSLFKQLSPLHGLDSSMAIILKTAAKLHATGVSVRYYNHHKHSYYLILNSGLNGLSHRELLMSAYAAALHYKDNFKIDMYTNQRLISSSDVSAIRKIALLIRLAEGLDRTMRGRVDEVSCDINDEQVIMQISARDNIDLEINEAMKSSGHFQKIYGKNLKVVPVILRDNI